MKKIRIAYWKSKLSGLDYEHNQTFDYSVDKLNEIIQNVLDKKYSLMLRPSEEGILIWLDKYRFGQS